MGRLEGKKKSKIHTRTLSMATYEADDGNIIVEGTLADHRLVDTYLMSGERRPAGILHHMSVKLLVGPPHLTIHDIEVDMISIPRPHCAEIIRSYDRIKGVTVSSGFTVKIKELMGGINGCSHVTALLVAMGPTVVQGYYTYFAGKSGHGTHPEIRRAVNRHIKNTCHVWREDGPHYKEIMALAKEDPA